MKYGVWFVRLLFASWMIPAGVNHFVPLFPQPMGSQPLSHELIVALIDSHLFDLVKVVELLAGLSVLTGIFTPLALLLCMPVSFCVFYWDAPLEGWSSRAAQFGYSVLLCNVLLCIAYVRSYRDLFVARLPSRGTLLLVARLVLGAWMLANGLNHFIGAWQPPVGHEPMAIQLMDAFSHSGLLTVAMSIELVAGALILAGLFVPLALCVLMPVSTCALYWSLILDHHPLNAALAILAVALNAWLMFASLDRYSGALARYARTLGETGVDFQAMYVNAGGRTSRAEFIPALLVMVALILFYLFLVRGRTAQFCLLVLLFPAVVLHARRLRDMHRTPWLLVLPAALVIALFAVRLGYASFGASIDASLPPVTLALCIGFALWGCAGSTRTAAGLPASAAPA
jgi:uncharacterized membrane protein YphA (DoxX/SURF4 family)/uncharacterized membrane protein YhaH (DUF805 family)